MNKPLGYYTPGDGGLLDQMQESWGERFQSLSNVERTWMIVKIADKLCADFCNETEDNSVREGVEKAVERICLDELSIGDQLRLIETLANQVINS